MWNMYNHMKPPYFSLKIRLLFTDFFRIRILIRIRIRNVYFGSGSDPDPAKIFGSIQFRIRNNASLKRYRAVRTYLFENFTCMLALLWYRKGRGMGRAAQSQNMGGGRGPSRAEVEFRSYCMEKGGGGGLLACLIPWYRQFTTAYVFIYNDNIVGGYCSVVDQAWFIPNPDSTFQIIPGRFRIRTWN